MSSQIWWFATRGAGMMTWAMSTMSIVLGLLLGSRVMGRRPGFPWLLDLHRFASGLTFAFLAVHLVTLWADSYVDFGWAELFVPFRSTWRPGAVAWGIVAMYLMVAIEVSSLLKSRLPDRWWHGIHLTSYLVMILGTIHSWQAGSDVQNPIVLAIGLAGTALVVGLTMLRLAVARSSIPVGRRAAPSSGTDRAAMLTAARKQAERPLTPAATPDRDPASVGRGARP